MKRRDPISVSIDSLDAEGKGVGRNAEGKVVFVEGALAGERVMAAVVRSKPAFDVLQTLSVHKAASGRRRPRCPHFGVCGGCATQHADAQTQMAAKQRGLEDCLARIGKVRPGSLLPILYGPEWGYRHRARLTVRRVAKKSGVLVGFHERRSSYVADMQSCEVLPRAVSALIAPPLRECIETLSIRERLPQIELAVGERATALVFRNLEPLTDQDAARLRAFAERHRVWAWLQPGGPATACPFHPAEGPVLDYALPEFGVRIGFGPTDFTQVNHPVNRVLVQRALRLLAPAPGERIGDLFCGVGNFSLPIATTGAEVVGLEGSAALVERARDNAIANRLEDRASFQVSDLYGAAAETLARQGPFDGLLIDPPREGAIDVVKALAAPLPRRIVYVSCDPATLARDAGALVNLRGYRLQAAGVVNMFPHTAHVESIALFER